MVGVPGRSKACNTCKKRKVSCSGEKPKCHTCIKSSRICTGYQRERIFIFDQRTEGDGPKSYRKPNVAAATAAATALAEKTQKTRHQAAAEREKSPGCKVVDFNTATGKVVARIAIPGSAVYRQQLLSNFVSGMLDQKNFGRHIGDWITLIPGLPKMTAALESSIMAICTVSVGRSSKDPALARESLKFYTKGLWELQKALWDPNLMHRDETCGACVALVIYEVIECPDKTIDGWKSHMAGCAKLFELKGATSFKSDFGYSLFLAFRLMEIQQAIAERRSTYLANEDWCTNPFKGRTKPELQKFLDVMAQLPNLLADGNKLLGNQPPGEERDPGETLLGIFGLRDRGWKLDAKFQAFFEAFKKTNPGPLYSPQLPTWAPLAMESPEQGRVFPVAFQFPNLETAHLCLVFWASSAILWSGMSFTRKVLQSFKLPGHLVQFPPLEHREDAASLARNICQSGEYMMTQSGPGRVSSIFPLKVAIEIYTDVPDCEREVEWALNWMSMITGLGGVNLIKHMPLPLTDHNYIP